MRFSLSAAFAFAAVACVLTVGNARAQLLADYAWGSNANGQLGNGTSGNQENSPVAVIGLPGGITSIATGGYQSLAIQNGGAYDWGENTYGQLGNGSATDSSTPVAVNGLSTGVTSISGGEYHSLAIQNGGVYAWGSNSNGQLGNGTTTDSNTPVAVTSLSSGVTAIAGGRYFSLAIQNGGVYAWGYNNFGQLGNGTSGNQENSPVAVSGMSSGVTAIAAGIYHSLAIQNGALYAWGGNDHGELGNGTFNVNSSTPVAVTNLSSGVTAIAAGGAYSLAVQNGSVYAWGYNAYGELGDGTTTDQTTPERIDPTDLNTITEVAAGAQNSYALSSDGSLWVWGDNTYGEMGLGTSTTDYLTPQHLLPPTGYEFTSIATNNLAYFVDATLEQTPEPTTLGLIGLAAMGLVGRRRRRN